MLEIIALVAEPLGVFCLSIEAIKLDNFARLQNRARNFYRKVNPHMKFSDAPAADSAPSSRFSFSDVIAGIPIIFLITPIAIVFAPVIWLLRKLEEHTLTGSIGALGFLLWGASFLINRLI